MRTPLELIRQFVRRQAKEELETYIGDSKKLAQQEIQRLLRNAETRWKLLANGKAGVDIDRDVRLLDITFDKPTEIAGYIDNMGLVDSDTYKVAIMTDIRGGDSLTPLYGTTYDGPVEDYVSLRQQVVIGRIVVVYKQTKGLPRDIYFSFFGR